MNRHIAADPENAAEEHKHAREQERAHPVRLHALHTLRPSFADSPADGKSPAHNGIQSPSTVVPISRRPSLALAGLQILLGYAWLVAGVDKLLLRGFPGMLGSLLNSTIHGGMIPGPFAALLQTLVIPRGSIFGTLVEWGEQLTGLGLIAGGLTALFAEPIERRIFPAGAQLIGWLSRLMRVLAPLAALGGLLMGFSFYLVDGAPSQGFMPSVAFGGALDEGFLLALGSLVVLSEPATAWVRHLARERGARVAPAHLAAAPDHRPRRETVPSH
jgi:hypothetical protein